VRRLRPDPDDPDSDNAVDVAAAYAVDAVRHVRANFVSSLDGAVTVSGKSAGLSSEADRALFHLLRRLTDVVLVGAGTARTENYGGAKPIDGHAPPIAVVSKSLDFDTSSRLFTDTAVRPIVITCAASPDAVRSRLAEVAEVIVAGDDEVDLRTALDVLADRGLGRVLCEGGPHLLGSLAAAGALDELCLTLSPLIAGGTAGRIVAGYLPEVVEPMHLLHVLEDDGHLFLRYSTTSG
jgi:riboflavin biosynthesis pyrimidine reductase